MTVFFQELGKILLNTQTVPPARVLSQPKWQDRPRPWYLVYRWLLFFIWTSMFICSILTYYKLYMKLWFIYLTNWDLTIGIIHAFLGAIIVTKRVILQRTPNFDADNITMGLIEKIYWFLYVVTSSMALLVTIIYWAVIYNPQTKKIDYQNIMVHMFNSLLMLMDVFISGVSFHIIHFWWCLVIMTNYVIFTAIYYVVGGHNTHGDHYIYTFLDWKKPQQALLVCLGIIVFVITLHCFYCYLTLIRDSIYRKLSRKKRKSIIHSDI